MTQLFDLAGGVELTTLDGEYGMYIVEKDSGGTPTQSRFVTLATLKGYVNTDPSVVPSSNPWRGCRVRLTANQSIASGTAFTTAIWQAEDVDTDGIWTLGAATRLTVPVGVSRVRLSASISLAVGTATPTISLNKNGAIAAGGFLQVGAGTATAAGVAAQSGSLEVSSGDYFELRVLHGAGSAANLIAEGRTWFEMEVVEATP